MNIREKSKTEQLDSVANVIFYLSHVITLTLRGLLQFLGKKFIIEDRNLKVSI